MSEADDIIVVDNLAVHHTYGEAQRAMRDFFYDIGIELLFLQVYSPDLNPAVEERFSKLNYLLTYSYQGHVFEKFRICSVTSGWGYNSSRPVWILQACRISDLKSWFHLFQAGSERKTFALFIPALEESSAMNHFSVF